jgi:hypothetical protein
MQVSSLPPGPAELLGPAVAGFLTDRDLAPSSHRVYALTLIRLVAQLGPDMPVAAISTAMLARFLATTYAHLAAASYNRVAATLGSLFAYTTRQGWTPVSPAVGLERRRQLRTAGPITVEDRGPGPFGTNKGANARTRAVPRGRVAGLPDRRPPVAGQDPVVVAVRDRRPRR